MLDTAISGVTNLALRATVRNDDGVDQLHHFVTVTLFAFFGAITGFVEFAGEPLNCWNYGNYMWQHFQDHVNKYCWSHTLYRYPNTTNLSIMPYELNQDGSPLNPDDPNKPKEELGYIESFRWVTAIFIVQALLFKLPNVFWSEINTSSGSNIYKMVEMLQGVLFAEEDEKKKKLNQLGLFVEKWLRIHHKPHWIMRRGVVRQTLSCCTLCAGDNSNNYLSTFYLVTKAIFLVNVIFQFLLLSLFLKINFWNFGVEVLQAYSEDTMRGATTETFPTVAVCHFMTLDKHQQYGQWEQCILTINIFLEKLFLFEWIWLLLLLVITIINFCVWCFKILQTQTALTFVKKYMKLMDVYSEARPVPDGCSVEQFVMEYLRNDGVFILRILAVNTNEVVVSQLVEELWGRYLRLHEAQSVKEGVEMKEAETPLLEEKSASPTADPAV